MLAAWHDDDQYVYYSSTRIALVLINNKNVRAINPGKQTKQDYNSKWSKLIKRRIMKGFEQLLY